MVARVGCFLHVARTQIQQENTVKCPSGRRYRSMFVHRDGIRRLIAGKKEYCFRFKNRLSNPVRELGLKIGPGAGSFKVSCRRVRKANFL